MVALRPPSLVVPALLALVLGQGCGSAASDSRPDLVLIVMDTARADLTSVYGWPRPTTPWLEQFARTATRFDRAYSTSCWTLPAHASMFTGELPDVHGADQVSGRLTADLPLLAELLAAAGYQTAGFTRNPWISERSGLQRGFQTFGEVWPGAEGLARDEPGGNPAVQGVEDWLERERDPARPGFLFVNLIRPHAPYVPSWRMARPLLPDEATWRESLLRYSSGGPRGLFERHYARVDPLDEQEWGRARGLYEGELRHTDELVRRLVEAVDGARGGAPPREAIVLVVSDHGENLGDHDHASHMFSLHESLTRVICLARGPGFPAGAADARLAQLTDLFPTLLAAAGIEPPPGPGRDLRAPAADGRVLLSRVAWPRIWLESFSPGIEASGVLERYKHALWAAQDERYKLVVASDDQELLFDLADDPREERPLAPDALEPARLGLMRKLIELSRARRPGDSEGEGGSPPSAFEGPDAATLEALRALGYAR